MTYSAQWTVQGAFNKIARFSPTSLWYACVRDPSCGVATVPHTCNIKLAGFSKDENTGYPVISTLQKLEYRLKDIPGPLPQVSGPKYMMKGEFGADFKDLQYVQVLKTIAAGRPLELPIDFSLMIDDVRYSVCERDWV